MKKLLFFLSLLLISCAAHSVPMYIVTAADHKYFNNVINLLGSLFKHNFNNLEEVALFDLGLTPEQKKYLGTIEKVTIYDVEAVSADILKPRQHAGRMVPGLYAWKPVILKQSLERFPYVLYMDAGITILNPLDDVFEYISSQGYFLVDCNHSIAWMTPSTLATKFNLHNPKNAWILHPQTRGIDAGLQGISRAVQETYVKPVYELARDIHNFIDDGTTPQGFGTGRHDQTLFSIIARLQRMTVHVIDNGDGTLVTLALKERNVPVHMTWDPKHVRRDTVIFHSRHYMPHINYFKKYLRFKNR